MGHGHVTPNPNGSKARCGGPAICKECALELAASAGRRMFDVVISGHTVASFSYADQAAEWLRRNYSNAGKVVETSDLRAEVDRLRAENEVLRRSCERLKGYMTDDLESNLAALGEMLQAEGKLATDL